MADFQITPADELDRLLEKMTALQREILLGRVFNGRIHGDWCWHGPTQSACIYGSAYYVMTGVEPPGLCELQEWVEGLIGVVPVKFYTPLEAEVWHIRPGDTPDNSFKSRWLYDHIQAYIARAEAPQVVQS